jgi:hypothetical protein
MIIKGSIVRIKNTGEITNVLEVRLIRGVKHAVIMSKELQRSIKLNEIELIKGVDN